MMVISVVSVGSVKLIVWSVYVTATVAVFEATVSSVFEGRHLRCDGSRA